MRTNHGRVTEHISSMLKLLAFRRSSGVETHRLATRAVCTEELIKSKFTYRTRNRKAVTEVRKLRKNKFAIIIMGIMPSECRGAGG